MIEVNNPQHDPPHPGKILKELYLDPMGLSVEQLAAKLDIYTLFVQGLVDGAVPVKPNVAIRLAKALNTTPELWMNLQSSYDLYHEAKLMKK